MRLDSFIDLAPYACLLVLLVAATAIVKPWGVFRRRWQAGLAVFGLALAIGGLVSIVPTRPSQITPAEWDRRVAICRDHHVGQFRDCVRDVTELKKAEAAGKEAANEAASALKPLPAEKEPRDPNDKRLPDNPKIKASALKPYNRKDDLDIFGSWGSGGVKKIETLRKTAAYAVAKKDGCDVVDLAEIADQRSKPPHEITISVTCRNETQYFLTQADIQSGTMTEEDRVAAVKTVPFRNACSEMAQSMLRYPSSYDQHFFGGGAFKDNAGNYGLEIDFDALNGFGAKVPHAALCTLMPTGKIKIQIRDR